MRVIHVPISEMLWPPKKSRKLRWRSARHACEKSPMATLASLSLGVLGSGVIHLLLLDAREAANGVTSILLR